MSHEDDRCENEIDFVFGKTPFSFPLLFLSALFKVETQCFKGDMGSKGPKNQSVAFENGETLLSSTIASLFILPSRRKLLKDVCNSIYLS